MKFYALLLAALCVMTPSVEANETFESSELASARCARAATRFNRMWSKLDTDNSGTVTAKEWMGFFQKRFAKHGRKMSKRVAAHKMKHFKKWAGSKKYIAKKDVWAKISKRKRC